MAATVKDITFGVRLDESGFDSGMEKAKKKVEATKKEVEGVGTKAKGAFTKAGSAAAGWGKSFASALINPITAVFAGGAFAAAITGGIKNSFTAAFESAKIDQTLAAQLRNLGRGDALQGINDLTDKISSAFNIDDEDIKTGMTNMLKSLRPEQAKGLAGLTADVAKATGKSFTDAAKVMAEAASGDVGPLKELGIMLESTGDKAKDAQLALAALQKTYGGQGATIAAAESPAVGLGIALDKLRETFGQSIAPLLVPLIQNITEFLRALSDSGALKETMNTLVGFFTQQLEYWKVIWDAIRSGNWVQLIINLAMMMIQNLVALIKASGFGLMRWFVRLMYEAGWEGAKLLLKAVKAVIPKKLSGWLGIDEAIKGVEKKIKDFDVVDDDVMGAFADFGKSYMANQQGFIEGMKQSNALAADSADKSSAAAGRMRDAAEVYNQSSIAGGVSAMAVESSRAKAAEKAATEAEKSAKAAEKERKEWAKAKQAMGGYQSGGGMGGAGGGGMAVRRNGRFVGGGYGYMSMSGYAPRYVVGGGPNAQIPIQNPGNAVALPQYDPRKGMGDLSAFSGEAITHYGADNLQNLYNQQYAQRYAAAQAQNIKVHIYSQQNMHGSMVNT